MGYDWGYGGPDVEYNPNREPHRLRKGLYAKIVLALVLLTVLVYTGVVLFINLQGLEVQSELTYCFYAFFGTEVISLVTIKVVKVKGDDKDAIYRNNRIDAPEESAGRSGGPAGMPEADPTDQPDGGGLGL